MRELTVTTTDGRTLEVLEGGDPDGFPLLFHSGTPSAAVASPMFEAAAKAASLRLITFSRPGYGSSTPRRQPGQVADDVADSTTVLDGLGVSEFITLGWSGGGPRALACAAMLPTRCRAAATLAGVGPADAPDLDFTEGMGPENQAEFAAAAAGPEAYAEYLGADAAQLASITGADVAASLGELVTPVDAAALTGDFAEWLAATFRRAFAQGVIGWRDDGLALLRAWGFDIATMIVPISVWQGRHDAMVPYAHGVWLADHIPGAEAHLFEDEGHISVVMRIDEIVADLRSIAGLPALGPA